MVPRIVLDTNVLLSAFGWRGSPYEVLHRGLEGQFRLLVSPELLEEFQRVLAYPKFGFSEIDGARFLLTISEGAEIVFPTQRLSVVTQDPADDRVLECALAGAADFIVSGDVHLKGLKNFKGTPILSPTEFLERFP